MRKSRLIFSLGLLVILLTATLSMNRPVSAAASDLFISEYIEGSSFNKAIEIYNGTGAAVDLGAGLYTLELYSNGAASPSQSVALTGTIVDGDVFVLANGSADPAVLAETDLVSSSVINFNGDDAVVLRKDGAVVDAFGQVGFDPGSEWVGGGQNDTLRRAEAVCAGDTNPDDAFDASAEWVVFAQDAFDGLGSHTANCGGVTTADPVINEFSASTTGTDVEYVEVFGSPDTDYSAYTILEIEGDSTSATGTVDEVIAVGSTDTNGFWLGDLAANSLENGTITLLLVNNFTGANGDDLDSDDDGILDSTPWDAIVDAVSVNDGGAGDLTYGTPALGPNYDGISSFAPGGASRIPDGLDTDGATDWVRNDFDLAGIPGFTGSIGLGEAYNTPGTANELFVPPPLDCTTPDVTTPIYDIQGNGAASPLDGSAVVIDGVVVGDFQPNDGDHTDLGGFFVQDPVGDGDPLTSDGIFVFAPSAVDVSEGDLVRVSGTVDEFFDMTELTAVDNVLLCGTGSVAPTTITIPTDFEAVEGMLVTTAGQTLYISEYFNFDRFGEMVLTPDRQFQPTAVYAPGSPEQAALAAANAANRITLDDGRTSQNPDPAIHPNGMVFDLTNTFRGGDSLDNVTGVINYSFSLYRIQPTQGADYTSLNPRTAAPDPVGGSLQVTSFNVLNYFNGDGMGGGFPTSRGADNLDEFNRQRAKIIAALVAMDSDVIGLMEIENDGYDSLSAIADLVNGLNDATAPGTYAFIDPGVPVIGTDEIAVGLIYNTTTVTPYGNSAILDSSVDSRFNDDKNRPALAQSFVENSTNGIFTVVVNHLKSKGSACDDVGDPDLGDGAGNCNITRMLAAEAMVDWLATDPTGSGDSDVLIIGDLNSYDKEDPIAAILAGSDDSLGTGDDYTDLAFAFGGEYAYSYVFDGQLGYLDYALASSSLVGQVTGATEWHINADEPDLLDYDTSFKQDAQDALYEPNAYRASDHDPVIVGLGLTSDLIRNADGCYVVALSGSPFDGLATEAMVGDAGYNGIRFHAGRWGLSQGLGDSTCYEIHGTDSGEIITGGLENDSIFGYGGNDLLLGLFGDDTFTGGAGADFINGQFGLDTILDYEPGIDFCVNVENGC
ncbi:MAG: ExeM/NucH family extracellular endonuclease [Ardenticatenaceae bacterium]|nr:ExeM/NucH family extracellular endonuclease [Anaerolineales bacterium]MCB9005901.1 ExeM/NucH family extracellular endonuclease [Ardenticatenaceae bacterium]